jgi:cobalamin-dependent methionine synthase I
LFLEMAGWLAVEQATKALALHVAEQVRDERLGPTRRLGPGYVDWPLDEQTGLFTLFEDAPLPVRLMESCAMIPKKSRSGLYGLRPLD